MIHKSLVFQQERGTCGSPPFGAISVAVWSYKSRCMSAPRCAHLPRSVDPATVEVTGFLFELQEGGIEIAKSDDTRINDEIRAPRVRLIGVDGSQLGLFDTRDAQRIADDQNLDLVEIAPNAEPPVCKVMDYGKFKYQQAMKAKQARKNQSKVEVKEMKFRPKIDVGDYETKKGHVLRFLKKGARVKITIMFRGREMAHPEQGLNVLERLAEDLKPFATVESQPKLEGRNMLMLLAPIKGAFDSEGDAEPSDK